MVSVIGWLNAISFLSVFFFEMIFGFFFIYKSKITRTRRLGIAGIMLCSVALLYLGYTVNFFYFLVEGENMIELYVIPLVIIGFSVFLINIMTIYFGMDLWLSKKTKEFVISINILCGIILSIVYLQDPGKFWYISNLSNIQEEFLIFSANISPFIIIVLFFIFQQFIFLGFGAYYKGMQSEGIIRRKYVLLSYGQILATTSAIIEFIIPWVIMKSFFRLLFLITAWMWYFALREERIKVKKEKPKKKDVKIEGDLFRLYEMPSENISEEDVVFHKERKICLVCKGTAEGFTFICPTCGALYCQKCAQTLTNLENACWACFGPIDPTKPVKITKPEPEKIGIKIDKSKKS